MILFYRILFIPILLVVAPYYAWRMIRRGGYGKDFSHRWGAHKKLPRKVDGKKRVWIQAVSVGEVEAIIPLVERFCARGDIELIITTTTSTGYEILRRKCADKVLYVGVFPLDFYPFSNRTWNNFNPDIVVLMEGELWPEHLHQARVRNVPVVLINARMSDKSYRRYSKFPMLAEKIFGRISLIAASNDYDMRRFIKLGADKNRVICAGNLKFDAPAQAILSPEEKLEFKRQFGFADNSLILLGSSTWAGEEAMLVCALKKIRQSGEDWRLLLVPRHAERRSTVIEDIKSLPYNVRTLSKQAPDGTLVYLADTTGELRVLTQLADMAFVGKSLSPNEGGQSPLECACCGVPMVYGDKMSNFRLICQTLEAHNAAIKVYSQEEAITELVRLSKNPDLRVTLGERACFWHSSNIGAADRCVSLILRGIV